MEPQVGGFINHIPGFTGVFCVLGGQQGFGALFPDFLQNLVQTLGVETGYIGGFRVCLFPGLQNPRQVFQYIAYCPCSSVAAVNSAGVLDHRVNADPLTIFQGPVEAAAPASMASDAALLFHLQQDDVLVAVQSNVPNDLLVS